MKGVLRDGLTRLDLLRENCSATAWLAAVPAGRCREYEARAAELLTPRESEYLARLTYPRRRHSYLLGRAAAKRAVLRYLGDTDPLTVEIGRGIFEQPVVQSERFEAAGVSIAHTEEWGLAVAHAAGHALGVDLERINPKHLDEVTSSLTAGELALAEPLGHAGIAALWVMKEALAKILRCGLTVPLEILEVDRIETDGRGLVSGTFQNFMQYKAHAWEERNHMIAIALPRRTTMEFLPNCDFFCWP